MFANIPEEWVAGLFASSIGVATLVLAQYEWYWETMCSGYWKQWNTPAGRTYSKCISVLIIVLGLALGAGLI